MGEAGRRIVLDNRGALARLLELIAPLVPDGESAVGLTAGQVMRSSCSSLERIYRAEVG